MIKNSTSATSARRIVLLVIILVVVPAFSEQETEAAPTRGTSAWTVFLHDGKTKAPWKGTLLPSASPLDNFHANMRRVCDWNVGKNAETDAGHPLNLEDLNVVDMGEWGSHRVFDVSNRSRGFNSIVVRLPNGQHRILYLQFNYAGIPNTYPYFVEIMDKCILCYRTRIPGTGSYWIEHYFLIDDETGSITELMLDRFDEVLSTILPDGYRIHRGGGLDIEKMLYSSPVWAPNDGPVIASDGSVELFLSIDENKLVVDKAVYKPETHSIVKTPTGLAR